MSVQPSSAEERPETAVKAWEEILINGVVKESAIADYFQFCSHDPLTGSKAFNNNRACAGKKKLRLACTVN